MEDKLVTLVTLTYAKAQVLKSVLESEGIMSELYNVNIIQPFVSSGVKVCINEKDLPRALEIVESGTWLKDDVVTDKKNVLVPVDFSDQSLLACYFAFDYAANIGAQVYLLHVFFPPVYSSMLPFENEVNSVEEYRMTMAKVKESMDSLVEKLNGMIEAKELPKVEFIPKIYEGIAEEEILRFANKKGSSLIVMGTRGKNLSKEKVIGSVTAEVIERSSVNVVAIPAETPYLRFSGMKRVAFMTNLDRRDLLSFDSLYDLIKDNNTDVVLVHLASDNNDWDQVKLAGLKDYFIGKYPQTNFEFKILPDDGTLESLTKFIDENKIDAVSIARYRRSILSRLLNPSMTKRVFFHMNTPLIIFNKG